MPVISPALLTSLVLASTAGESEEAELNSAVSLDVMVVALAPLLSSGTEYPLVLEYERAISQRWSFVVIPEVRLSVGSTPPPWIGLSIGLSGRYYVIDEPDMRGWWLGIEVGARHLVFGDGITYAPKWAAGLATGYNFALTKHFQLSLGLRTVWTPFLELMPRGALRFVF